MPPHFNPRPPRGERLAIAESGRRGTISIHVPLAGNDRTNRRTYRVRSHFNPRPPRGERRIAFSRIFCPRLFQSTSPSRGTTEFLFGECAFNVISIHVPLAGNDDFQTRINAGSFHFNPRPPRGERQGGKERAKKRQDFNPRPPRGERQDDFSDLKVKVEFQSTSPSRGTTQFGVNPGPIFEFQSTSPSRGTTAVSSLYFVCRSISIHVPLAGNDLRDGHFHSAQPYFNPRPPRGERQLHSERFGRRVKFQSTSPSRGTTLEHSDLPVLSGFQSTSPSRGTTTASLTISKPHTKFQSTSPSRGTTSRKR